MKPIILNDEDVIRLLSPTESVAVMESAFLARARGAAVGVPRWHLPFPNGQLTFTVGGVDDVVGFRAYLSGNLQRADQLTVVWSQYTGEMQGVVFGQLLGAARTGAIGGVAVKHLARSDATSLAMIGAGQQAYTQLRAILAARPAITDVRVFSRTPASREAFCDDMRALMPHLNISPTDSAEAAIRDADVVIGATTSRKPVIMGEWLKAGAHVTTIGPKAKDGAEIDFHVVTRADFIATDSPEQAAEIATVTEGSGKPIYDLAAVVSKQAGRPSDEAITLFLSVGLAGTEVALAAYLIEKSQFRQSHDAE